MIKNPPANAGDMSSIPGSGRSPEGGHGLPGHLVGEGFVGVAGHDALGNLGPGVELVGVEVAQFEAGDEQAAQRAVEVSLLDVATAYSLRQVLVFRAALHVGARQHGLC